MRKGTDRLCIINITYLTTDISEYTAESQIFHKFELIFDPTTSLFPSSRQHVTESDKILVNFALTLNTKKFCEVQ